VRIAATLTRWRCSSQHARVIGCEPAAGDEAAVATALATAMREHHEHVGVQSAGCEALAMLAKNSAAFCGAACAAGVGVVQAAGCRVRAAARAAAR
jgi:hypothetical protein